MLLDTQLTLQTICIQLRSHSNVAVFQFSPMFLLTLHLHYLTDDTVILHVIPYRSMGNLVVMMRVWLSLFLPSACLPVCRPLALPCNTTHEDTEREC
jgi:hypothetical protein